jgi:diaminohydroxyphosphoribosylaminopyrimidine deaminase/5-amino-6-(5-phosphoribosylamino)uracil reductase
MTELETAKSAATAIAHVEEAPKGRPFVVAQLGQSLDGRIATVAGDSQWINGTAALDHVHRLRAAVDAVVVGAGTIAADDPRLNVRRCPGENPARVAIDPNGRLRDDGQWLVDDGARRVVIVRDTTEPGADSAAARRDVDVVRLSPNDGASLSPPDIVAALSAMGLNKLLIEGGAHTVSRFIDTGALDRLHILVAPVIIGSGPHGLALAEITRLSDAHRPRAEITQLGDGDVLFDCDMRTAARTR